MTADLKPIPLDWPHGYETRDGHLVLFIGTRASRRLLWEQISNYLLIDTDINGANVRGRSSSLDILCKPAPAKRHARWIIWHSYAGEVCSAISLKEQNVGANFFPGVVVKCEGPFYYTEGEELQK